MVDQTLENLMNEGNELGTLRERVEKQPSNPLIRESLRPLYVKSNLKDPENPTKEGIAAAMKLVDDYGDSEVNGGVYGLIAQNQKEIADFAEANENKLYHTLLDETLIGLTADVLPVPEAGEEVEDHKSYREASEELQSGNVLEMRKYLRTILNEQIVDQLSDERLKLAYSGVVSTRRNEFLLNFETKEGTVGRGKLMKYLKSVKDAEDSDRTKFYFTLGIAASDKEKTKAA